MALPRVAFLSIFLLFLDFSFARNILRDASANQMLKEPPTEKDVQKTKHLAGIDSAYSSSANAKASNGLSNSGYESGYAYASGSEVGCGKSDDSGVGYGSRNEQGAKSKYDISIDVWRPGSNDGYGFGCGFGSGSGSGAEGYGYGSGSGVGTGDGGRGYGSGSGSGYGVGSNGDGEYGSRFGIDNGGLGYGPGGGMVYFPPFGALGPGNPLLGPGAGYISNIGVGYGSGSGSGYGYGSNGGFGYGSGIGSCSSSGGVGLLRGEGNRYVPGYSSGTPLDGVVDGPRIQYYGAGVGFGSGSGIGSGYGHGVGLGSSVGFGHNNGIGNGYLRGIGDGYIPGYGSRVGLGSSRDEQTGGGSVIDNGMHSGLSPIIEEAQTSILREDSNLAKEQQKVDHLTRSKPEVDTYRAKHNSKQRGGGLSGWAETEPRVSELRNTSNMDHNEPMPPDGAHDQADDAPNEELRDKTKPRS